MSGAGSMSSCFIPNGRKRRLTSLRVKSSDSTLPPFRPHKRLRTRKSDTHEPLDMAHLPGSSNNHKMSSSKVGFNNIAKKSNQGKKLVIKNRRGMTSVEMKGSGGGRVVLRLMLDDWYFPVLHCVCT